MIHYHRYHGVQRFCDQSDCVDRNKRLHKKSGAEDEGSTWAKARLAQCKQMTEQFRLGELDPTSDEVTASPYPPLNINALAVFDEHHHEKNRVIG